MDGFVLPITPVWFHQNTIIATPDNGLLYCSRFDVSYIPPVQPDCMPKISRMNHNAAIKNLACGTDWTLNRWFATYDDHRCVYIWDLDLRQPVKGHKGHAGGEKITSTWGKNTHDVTSAICFSLGQKLLSWDQGKLIVYCLLSDTYTAHDNLFRPKSTVVCLLPSPLDPNLFIAGMKDGLIQIFSLKTMTILHTLRGHDKEICSIVCMSVPVNHDKTACSSKKQKNTGSSATLPEGASKNNTPRPKKQARKKAAPVADTSDFLDIYDFNETQEEFGTIIDRKAQSERDEEFRQKTKTVEGFNFLEACENLKDDIMKAASRRDDDESDEEAEQSHINEERFNTDDENELDDCEKMRDYVVIDKDVNSSAEEEQEEEEEEEGCSFETKLVLLSSGRDSRLWFWDHESGLPIDNIKVPYAVNDRICDTSYVTSVWLDEHHVVANTSNGSVIEWKVSFSFKNHRIGLVSEMSLAPYPVEKIISVVRAEAPLKLNSKGSNGRYIWCSSINRRLICLEVSSQGKQNVVLDYGCIYPINRCLVENPLESMVIAIGCAAPRIETINLASIQYDNIPIRTVSNKICGTVMIVDWHPEDEQKLAFGTNEGRIGVIDVSSASNNPMILKAFTNKDIFALKWCYLTDDKKQKRLVLFASGKSQLAYYYMTGAKKYEQIICKQFGEVSSVSAADNLCFVGTQKGVVYINDLDNNLKNVYQQKVCARYISALEYKRNWLAVGSNDYAITVLKFDAENGVLSTPKITLLRGHEDGICKLRWSRGESMLLVSCSFDYTFRVWDASSETCLSVVNVGCFVYSAMFSPLDENIILYVGKGCSLSFCDYTKQETRTTLQDGSKKLQIKLASLANKEPVNKRTKKSRKGLDAAMKPVDTNAPQINSELLPNDINPLDKGADEVKSVATKESHHPLPVRSNVTTTFQLAYREINRPKEVLECIVKLLHTVVPEPEPEPVISDAEDDFSDEEGLKEVELKLKALEVKEQHTEDAQKRSSSSGDATNAAKDEKMFYNEKLFSTEEKLKQLIQEEVDSHQTPVTSSIGMVFLPQLLHKLKAVILENVSKKKLTPQLLALAPHVSHVFWRQCCQAYAFQLIENKQSLAAVPYLLASHQVDDTIEALCDAKYYREAWAVCRLQKMPDDPIREKVATEWANHLDLIGNLEAAALVWTGVKKYSNAIDVLSKRREITEDIQRTIDELNKKLQEGEPQKN